MVVVNSINVSFVTAPLTLHLIVFSEMLSLALIVNWRPSLMLMRVSARDMLTTGGLASG